MSKGRGTEKTLLLRSQFQATAAKGKGGILSLSFSFLLLFLKGRNVLNKSAVVREVWKGSISLG